MHSWRSCWEFIIAHDSLRKLGIFVVKQSKEMLTSIVIVSYNTLEFTQACIASIRQWTTDSRYELIVVDNGSCDGSAAWLLAQKDVYGIINKENAGFAKGCNQGTAAARGEAVLYLNSDTVVTPRWLEQMKAALYSDERVGAVSCVTNFCGNGQQIAVPYGQDIRAMFAFADRFNQKNPQKWERRLKLSGFCLLVKREALEKIPDGFDERFFPGNFEDDDFCRRLQIEGYRLLLCRDTFIHHFGSISFRKSYGMLGFDEQEKLFWGLLEKNWQLFRDKWRIKEAALEELAVRQEREETAYACIEKAYGRDSLPLVSILIFLSKCSAAFEAVLQSARGQTYSYIEILIVDSSADAQMARFMENYRADLRIRYYRNTTVHVKKDAFEMFKRAARGEFLQWVQNDEPLEPDQVTYMVAAAVGNRHLT